MGSLYFHDIDASRVINDFNTGWYSNYAGPWAKIQSKQYVGLVSPMLAAQYTEMEPGNRGSG